MIFNHLLKLLLLIGPFQTTTLLQAFNHRITSVGTRPLSNHHQLSLSQNNDNNEGLQFDMSKPVFDLYTFRGVRNDALIRYNSLHQSEPLRINLYLLATITLFSYTGLSEAVLDQQASPITSIASIAGGLFTTYRFIRECKRRSTKLIKMEKEMNSQSLSIRLPSGKFSDRIYGNKSMQLYGLKKEKRVLAICGNKDQLRDALIPFRVLRHRFVQSSTIIVVVPLDGSSVNDWGISDQEIRSSPFLAKVDDVNEWVDYFSSLVSDDDVKFEKDTKQLAWFGLSYSGKSFGSGLGLTIPRPIEILGQTLSPNFDLSDLEDEQSSFASRTEEDVGSIFESQTNFYDALTTGNMSNLKSIFDDNISTTLEVDDVINNGGRIDTWDTCLEEGARPSNMKTFNSDILIVSDTEAYSTIIECPESNDTFSKPTLLAMQRWAKNNGEWKLQLHQTIPWTFDSNYGGSGTLICDCRGCTALVQERKAKWSFNGLIK